MNCTVAELPEHVSGGSPGFPWLSCLPAAAWSCPLACGAQLWTGEGGVWGSALSSVPVFRIIIILTAVSAAVQNSLA